MELPSVAMRVIMVLIESRHHKDNPSLISTNKSAY